MDTNRTPLRVLIASLALVATGVCAQTIYKQVDENGRVLFTDQPNPSARVINTFETLRGRSQGGSDRQLDADSEAVTEPARRIDRMVPRVMAEDLQPAARFEAAATGAPVRVSNEQPARPYSAAPQLQDVPRVRGGDVERAVATYSALNTPMAAQADATEAARRARQEMQKSTAAQPILVLQPATRDHAVTATPVHSGMDTAYFIWAATFFALAAGLLYVGWQVIRLILGTAFPRWELGLA